MRLMDAAFDQYVVQGVAHNLGFGKSIIHNEAFAAGDYSTAFIPTFYPTGYNGDELSHDHRVRLSVAAHILKNQFLSYKNAKAALEDVFYVTIIGQGEEADQDWKVESSKGEFTVTNLGNGDVSTLSVDGCSFEHNSLLKMDTGSE